MKSMFFFFSPIEEGLKKHKGKSYFSTERPNDIKMLVDTPNDL